MFNLLNGATLVLDCVLFALVASYTGLTTSVHEHVCVCGRRRGYK